MINPRIERIEKPQKRKGCCIVAILALLIILVLCFIFRSKIESHIPLNVNNNISSTNPSYNLAGTLYFIKNKDIWKISGQNSSQVTHEKDISYLNVSTDGTEAVYSIVNTNESDLFEMNLQTGKKNQLTNDSSKYLDSNFWALAPFISSDGKSIVYLSDRSKLTYNNSDLSVFTMNTSTRLPREITHGYPYTGGDQNPSFYPGNSSYILYTKYIYAQDQPQPFSKLYLMDTNAMQSYALTPDFSGTYQASFSPDGTEIAFVKRDTIGGVDDTQSDIYIMPFSVSNISAANPENAFNTSYANAILIHSGKDAYPVFSPDGNKLAFYTLSNNQFNISEIDLKKITDKNGNVSIKPGKVNIVLNTTGIDTTSNLSWIDPNTTIN